MDFIKEFEEWLPIWSEKNMQPIPTRKHMDRWNMAWNDFIKEVLNEKWDEISSEYRSMRYKTEADVYNEKHKQTLDKIEEIKEQEEQEEDQLLSDWEKVKRLLK